MDHMIQGLVELIREEEALLKEFLTLLEEQKQILVRNDNEAFEATVSRQEELVEKIRSKEEERISRVAMLAKGLKATESDVTLTRLIEMSLGQVSEDLRAAKKTVTGLVNRINRVSQVNHYLIKRSLNTVQKNIGFLIDNGEPEVTYESSGKLRTRDVRSVLVNKTL